MAQTPPSDKQTVTDAIAGMSPEERQAWLENIDKQVERDMKARGEPFDPSKQHGIRFQNGPDGVFSGGGSRTYESGDVVMGNDTLTRGLTVAEFKSVIEHEKHHTQQDPKHAHDDPKWREDEAIKSEARVYGTAAPIGATEKLERRPPLPSGSHYLQPDPMEEIRIRQREQLIRDNSPPEHKNDYIEIVHPIPSPTQDMVQVPKDQAQNRVSGGDNLADHVKEAAAAAVVSSRASVNGGEEATVAHNNAYVNNTPGKSEPSQGV